MGAYGNVGTYYPKWLQMVLGFFNSAGHPTCTSADGKAIKTGDEAWVFSNKGRALDLLTVTSTPCPQKGDFNLHNAVGNVCVDSSYIYIDLDQSLNALQRGNLKYLSKPLPIHVSD